MADWITVVDDDTANLKIAGHILSELGMRISALKSGEMLLEFLKNNAPALILLDIHMPGMDGFETIRKLRALDAGAHVPVIFLTASGDENSVVEGLDMGADDYIAKPFRPRELLSRIKSVLRRAGRDSSMTLGRVSVDLDSGTVRKDGVSGLHGRHGIHLL